MTTTLEFDFVLDDQASGAANDVVASLEKLEKELVTLDKVTTGPTKGIKDLTKQLDVFSHGPANDVVASLKKVEKELITVDKVIAEPTKKIKALNKELHGGMDSSAKGIKDAAQQGSFFGTILGSLAAKAMALGVQAAAAIGRLAVDFGKASVEAVAFRESSSMGLEMLRGTDGTAQFERIKQISLEMRTPLQDTVKQFTKLAAMQFDQKSAETFFKRMQDLRAVGSSADQVGRAMLAITQIKSAGKLQGDELNQLAEAGVSVQLVMEEIAKAMGVSTAEVYKLKEAGKVTADIALPAIERAIGKKTGTPVAGEAGKKFMTTTLGGMFESITSLKDVLFDELGGAIGPALMELKPLMDKAFEFLRSPEFKAGLASFGGTMSTVIKFIGEHLPGAIAFIGKIWDVVSTGIEKFAPAIKSAFGGEGSGDFINQFGNALLRAFNIVAKIIGVIIVLVGWVFRLVGLAWTILEPLNILLWGILSLGMDLIAWGAKISSWILEAIVGGITRGTKWVIDAVKNLGKAALGALGITLDAHSPSRKFEVLGGSVPAGMAGGVDAGVPKVERAISHMVTLPKPAALRLVPPSGAGGALAPAPRAAGGTGGAGITVNQTFNIAGSSDPKATAQAVATQSTRGIEAALEAAAAA